MKAVEEGASRGTISNGYQKKVIQHLVWMPGAPAAGRTVAQTT